jgi:hypothetical protein
MGRWGGGCIALSAWDPKGGYLSPTRSLAACGHVDPRDEIPHGEWGSDV